MKLEGIIFKRRILKRLLLLLFVGSLFLQLPGCATLDPSLFKKRPSASLEKFDIKAISFQDITFLFDVKISNPYPLGIKLAGIKMDFFVEKSKILSTETSKGLKLPAKESKNNPFLVKLLYRDIEKLVRYYSSRDYLNCEIKGEIVVDLPKIAIPGFPSTWTVPFTVSQKIPAVKPVVRVKNFRVEMPKKQDVAKAIQKSANEALQPEKVIRFLGDVFQGKTKKAVESVTPKDLDLPLKVQFEIELENKTKAQLSFRNLDYKFFVEKEQLLKGETANVKRYGNKIRLLIKNEFSTKSLSKSVINAFKTKKINFQLKGDTKIQLPKSIKKEAVQLNIDEKGSFRL